jgi:excisionase family DNA binding protein
MVNKKPLRDHSPEMLSPRQVADLLGVSVTSLYARLHEEGPMPLPHVRAGRLFYIPRRGLNKWFKRIGAPDMHA